MCLLLRAAAGYRHMLCLATDMCSVCCRPQMPVVPSLAGMSLPTRLLLTSALWCHTIAWPCQTWCVCVCVCVTYVYASVSVCIHVYIGCMNWICTNPPPQNAIRDARINSNLRRVTFAQTPRMSTYLLAFIVGEFDYVEGFDTNGVRIRVYTPMAKSEQGEFALDVAKKTLPFYSNYFNVKYPLPKLDLIAIPDFSAGAMENWGLVTYRERLLLVDPQDTSLQSKQLVALVVGEPREGGWGVGEWVDHCAGLEGSAV